MSQSLAAVIYGESDSGKSTLAGSTPKPALILDVESGTRFVRAYKNKVYWNPLTGPYPEYTGQYDAVIVNVLDWATIQTAYQYLAETAHPFKSVVIDSLTEAQKRLVDAVAGTDNVTLQQWGTIGRHLEDLIRKFRDLTFHPKYPVEVVLFLCLAHLRDAYTRPYIRGSLELSLPAFVDVVSFLYKDFENGTIKHRALLASTPNIIAKDRTGALVSELGQVVEDANISEWLEILEREFGGNE